MHKFLKITGIILGTLFLLIGGALLALQLPSVQKIILDKALEKIGGSFDGDFSAGSITLLPFNTVILRDVVILDREPFPYPSDPAAPVDTFARIGYAAVKLSPRTILNGEGVLMHKATVRNGVFNLTIEPNKDSLISNRTVTNLQRIFNLENPKKKNKKEPGRVFEIEKVKVEHFTFRMKNYYQREVLKKRGKADLYDGGINWNDLDLTADVDGRNLGMTGFLMHGTADHVRIREKSGIVIDHVEGSTVVGKGKTLIENIRIRDAYSDIDVPSLRFLYGDQQHFNDFVDGVRIVARANRSKVDLGRTIGYFAPALLGNPLVIDLYGADVDGPVSDLGIKNFHFKDLTSGVGGKADVRLTGLPDNEFNLAFDVYPFDFTTASLSTFIRGWAPGTNLPLGKYAQRERFSLEARGNGNLNHLTVSGTLNSTAGKVRLDHLLLENLINRQTIAIGGGIATESLDVGRIINNKKIGKVSLKTCLEASLGKQPVVTVDSVSISRLHAMDYDYSNIRGYGVYSGKSFNGRIVSHDPNLDFIADGMVRFPGKKSKYASYECSVSLGYADLHALHLLKNRDLKVSLNTDVNFVRTAAGDMVGDIGVTDISLSNENGRYHIGDISLQSHANDTTNRMKLESDFCTGSYVSKEPATVFFKELLNQTVRKEIPVLFRDKAERTPPTDYAVNLKFQNTRKLLDFIYPSAYIEDNTTLKLNLDKDGQLSARIRSGRLAINEHYLRNLNIDIDNSDGKLNALLESGELRAGGMLFKDAIGLITADDNLIRVDLDYDNKTTPENKGDIQLTAEVRRTGAGVLELSARALPSTLSYEGNRWNLSSDEILLSGNDIRINAFKGTSKGQHILVDGGISPDKTDTLSLSMKRFDISLLSGLIGGGYTVGGRVTGSATLSSPSKGMPGIQVSLGCDSTYVAGFPLGHLDVESKWDEGRKRFLVEVDNRLDGKNNINAQGWITRKGELDITASLDSLNLGYAKPILASVFSTFEGGVSGKLRASGTFKDLHLESQDAFLNDAHLTLDYTKVPYIVNGPVTITEKVIRFDNDDIRDMASGTGKVTGGVYFNTLKNISLGVLLNVRDMKVLDTHEGDDPSFYGNLAATGTVNVTGPLSTVGVDINARTSGAGELHIPLNNASGEKRTFLTFYQPVIEEEEDEYDRMIKKKKKDAAVNTDLAVNIHVVTTPEIKALIEVDKSTGNILTAEGNGNMDLAYRSKGNYFGINGYYNITAGSYQFKALEIINKTFTVRDGSTVRFNGDIMDTDLDIDALYTTKTSLSKLLEESESVETRRTVECGFNITDKLRNPQIKLSINVPDLDPTTQAQVESALNTEDKVQKQFLYLLLTGSFMPSDFSGVVNNSSDMLFSNVSSIMTNQINNIFQKLGIPLDLGLNYKSSEAGNDLFDVAVSTALFKNRVIVNGAIGNREFSTKGSTSVVGDLDIEIKLDRQGSIRLNLFSHSADQYSNYLDFSQRNGGGITYQREFNTFRQFFRTLFTSRKRRRENYYLEGRTIQRVTLEVDKDGNIIGQEPRRKKKKK